MSRGGGKKERENARCQRALDRGALDNDGNERTRPSKKTHSDPCEKKNEGRPKPDQSIRVAARGFFAGALLIQSVYFVPTWDVKKKKKRKNNTHGKNGMWNRGRNIFSNYQYKRGISHSRLKHPLQHPQRRDSHERCVWRFGVSERGANIVPTETYPSEPHV